MASKTSTYRHQAIIMILVFTLALSMSSTRAQKVSASTVPVVLSNFAFVPQNLTIYQGDTILWNNTDPVIYTLWFVRVSDGSTYMISEPILPTETWATGFSELIELQYFDFNRLWITGWILVTIPGDINGDKKVNILDAIMLANAFASRPGDLNWNPDADINGDNVVNILDAILLAGHFGESWP